jgi:hypothetical protein
VIVKLSDPLHNPDKICVHLVMIWEVRNGYFKVFRRAKGPGFEELG